MKAVNTAKKQTSVTKKQAVEQELAELKAALDQGLADARKGIFGR